MPCLLLDFRPLDGWQCQSPLCRLTWLALALNHPHGFPRDALVLLTLRLIPSHMAVNAIRNYVGWPASATWWFNAIVIGWASFWPKLHHCLLTERIHLQIHMSLDNWNPHVGCDIIKALFIGIFEHRKELLVDDCKNLVQAACSPTHAHSTAQLANLRSPWQHAPERFDFRTSHSTAWKTLLSHPQGLGCMACISMIGRAGYSFCSLLSL